MTKLELKQLIVSYTDTLENQFAIDLYSLLKEYVNIKVITDYYSNVDYVITDKNNLDNKIYIELKSRNTNGYFFNSFIIGKTKINNINKNYKNTILVWSFKDNIYFTKCIKDFDNYKSKIINGSYIIEIDKALCSCNMDNLKKTILDMLFK